MSGPTKPAERTFVVTESAVKALAASLQAHMNGRAALDQLFVQCMNDAWRAFDKSLTRVEDEPTQPPPSPSNS